MAKHDFHNSDELTRRLQAARPAAPETPAAFKSGLRTRLLRSYNTQPAAAARPWLPVSVAGVALALVAVVAFFLWPSPKAQVASAAELLQQANRHLADQASGAAVIYDRLLLDQEAGMVSRQGMVGELWQSPDGQRFRYVLWSAEGELLYFAQRDGDRLWRSFNNLPTGAEAVSTVYQMTMDQYRQSRLPAMTEGHNVLFAELSTGWLEIDRTLADSGGSCADLFCLLGLAGGNWQCEEGSCSLMAGDTVFAVARLQPDELLAAGRVLHVVAIEYPQREWTRVIKLDAETSALVEIANFDRGNPVDRLQHVERQALAAGAVPAGLFSQAPEGIQVLAFGEPAEPPAEATGQPEATAGGEAQPAGSDRVWIVSVSPEPGTVLSGPVEFQVTLGYELATLPEASLRVDLYPNFEWTSIQVEGSDFVKVTAGTGTVEVRFNVSPETLQAGKWILQTTMGTFEGFRLIVIANQEWPEYEWCVRCKE